MSTLDLEPIKERLDKAHTEWGPWKAKEDSWDGYSVVIDDNGPGVSIIAEQIGQGEDEGRGDAEFIAHAPEDIAALVAEVERLKEAVIVEQNRRKPWVKLAHQNAQEVKRLRGQVEAVRAATANHPDPCEKHPDGDAVTCGWKSAYQDVVWALEVGE